jgi:hypothetical protein
MAEKDDKFVVVINGQRASGLLTEADAKKEAAARKPAQENTEDEKKPKVEVLQNLFG